MRMRWKRRKPTASDTAPAFISEGSEITGNCSFSGAVVLSGTAKGEIQATTTLTVGRPGRLEARLRAPVVIIEGEVIGSVIATERIEIREHARVFGDLETAVLVIEEGAIVEGQTKSSQRHDGVTGKSRRAGDAAPGMTTSFVAAGS
jgi:cytoskeletal protein CcmA (bactofilin family)